ncbi:TetR/AcrR family transcriptional regulator [Streptomyces venetus]|uniref:TetR/AcrR family transcriptional regulator n=1 Tax=Streptomyces venetus TaxID=1701086 RepID=UPI003C2CC0F0
MPDIKHFDPDAVLETVVRLFWRQGVAGTGIQDVVTATGLNRSSLYATFGGKRDLYGAALRRYIDQWSRPAFRSLAQDQRGLRAVAEFFDGLIAVRCAGEHARWGCLVVNAHTGAENGDPEVRDLLEQHHRELRDALHTALVAAEAQGQLASGTDPGAAAEVLALLAYGVNLRSRAGADAKALHATVATALQSLGNPTTA